MSTTPHERSRHDRRASHEPTRDERRASPLGAFLATAGALLLLVSIWLDWLTLGPADSEANPSSGYESDGTIPFFAYLAVGFALALLYALKRADRRQHRGLSLASFAAGLATLLWTLSFIIDPIATAQYNETNVSIELGPWIALVGALLWALGSFLLAKEVEGDFEEIHPATVTRPVETHTETRGTQPEVHHHTAQEVHDVHDNGASVARPASPGATRSAT